MRGGRCKQAPRRGCPLDGNTLDLGSRQDGGEEFGRSWAFLPPPDGEYRPIPPSAIHGATGYFASSTGFVRTPRGYTTSGCTAGGREYPVVTLGNRHEYKVHRLVAAAFLEADSERPWVNHINGVKTDCRIENLEWTTARENALHAIEIGLTPPRTDGGRIDRYDAGGEYVGTYASLQLAAAAVGTRHYQNILACCRGRQKTAYGCKWRYSEHTSTGRPMVAGEEGHPRAKGG